jgi:hypothetical protein
VPTRRNATSGAASFVEIQQNSRFLTGLGARFGMTSVELEVFAARLEAAPFQSDGGSKATAVPNLLEAFDRGGFVVLHIEDGVELGDLEQVVHFLG